MDDVASGSQIDFDINTAGAQEYDVYESVTGQADNIVSVDNLRDYSGGFITIIFGIGLIAGIIFAKFSSWR